MICEKRNMSDTTDPREEDTASDVPIDGMPATKMSRLEDPMPESSDRNLETEFNTLKTLIPGLSERPNLEELDIIDACVSYIQSLRNQLYPRSRHTSAARTEPEKSSESSSADSDSDTQPQLEGMVAVIEASSPQTVLLKSLNDLSDSENKENAG